MRKRGSSRPSIDWTRFWWPRYWAKTQHFTSCIQHGIYTQLLGHCMMNGPLPDDHEYLRNICKADEDQWERYGEPILARFFQLHRGHLVNQRAMTERHWSASRIESFRDRGKAGAEARWQDAEKEAMPKRKARRRVKARQPEMPIDDSVPSASDLDQCATPEGQPPPPASGGKDGGEGGWDSGLDDDVGGNVDVKPAGLRAPHTTANGRTAKKFPAEITEIKSAFAYYNHVAAAHGLPLAETLTDERKIKLRQRLADAGGLHGWEQALDRMVTIPGMLGRAGDGHWRANLDFVLQKSSFIRLREGAYDHWKPANGTHHDTNGIKSAILNGAGLGDLDGGGAAAGDGDAPSFEGRTADRGRIAAPRGRQTRRR